jgi:hypothetical protein
MSGLGALLGVWLGLLLTTPAEPWPEGLPFALAGEGFDNGWRWIFFGFNLWVPMTYARSAESFPSRARTTGFALVDGVAHLGGGIRVLVIAPLIPKMSVFGAFMLVSSFLVAAAVLGMFGVETRNKRFEEISP